MQTKSPIQRAMTLSVMVFLTIANSATNAQTQNCPQTKCETFKNESAHNAPTVIIKAEHGAKMNFAYGEIVDHEALEVSFTLHIVGPWDGTRYPKWGPDRMIVSIDQEKGKINLLDATFNNCFLLFIDNVWQTYPDPYHPRQGIGRNYRRMLQFGGSGAERIASLGFASNRQKSVDTTYRFHFLVKHSTSNAEVSFFTDWKEDASSSSYWVENLQVKPLIQSPPLNQETEELAWQAILSSDATAAQQAWSTVFTAHPDLYLKRVQSLVTTNPVRRKWMIKELSKGPTPVESLIRPVNFPSQENSKETLHRISLLRELALSHDPYTATSRFFSPKKHTPLTLAIRTACVANKGLEVRRIKMRVSGYLRMIQNENAATLLKKFDQPIPKTQWAADSEDPKEETVVPN